MQLYNMWLFIVLLTSLMLSVNSIDGAKMQNESPVPVALTSDEHQSLLGDIYKKECWNFTHGDPSKGVFYSPNFPNEYPNNIECVQYLEAPHGLTIHLDFRDIFQIETSDSCKYDSLEFRDGPFGYSPLLGRYCGKDYPPLIITTTRFLWIRFKSDRNLGDKGFKAVYSFIKKQDYNPKKEELKVCRRTVGEYPPQSVLTTDTFPLADTSSSGYPRDDPIDCTWEIQVEPGSKIRLSKFGVRFPVPGDCSSNFMEIYDRSTSLDSRVFHFCKAPLPEYQSTSSKVYLRTYGNSLKNKPFMTVLYTAYRTGVACDKDTEFACDKRCISNSLVCNGHSNCPNGQDEENCGSDTVVVVTEIPLYMIILGAVVGFIGTSILIGVCITCRHKRKMKKREKEAKKQEAKLKQEAMEMTSNSSSTTLSSKKGMIPPPYYSLPRPHTKSSGHNIHRNSLTNSLQTPSEGEYPDQNSDPGNYKKYMAMDQYMEEESSPCPSLYNQGPPVLTTIVERHDFPPGQTDIEGSGYGWGGGYGWRQQRTMEPRSPPTLSENIAKLAQYTIPKSHSPYSPPESKIYNPETRYEIYPNKPFQIGMKYGMGSDNSETTPEQQKLFKMRSQHPDITRDIEIT